MHKLLISLLGLMLIGILGYFCFLAKVSGITNHLISGATNAFDQNKMGWIDTQLKGEGLGATRILILNGTAPTIELKDEAEKIALAQEGVSRVKNFLVVKETTSKTIGVPSAKSDEPKVVIPSPYTIEVHKSKDAKIVLKGYVPNEESHESLVAKAKTLLGSKNIIDLLKESRGAPKKWVDSAQLGLDKLVDVEYGNYKIVDNTFTFKGAVDNVAKKELLTKELQLNLEATYKGDFIIDTPTIKNIPKPTIKLLAEKPLFSCQLAFKKILSDNKIHFAYNKADIKSSSYRLLDSLVEIANKCPQEIIAIQGHTDSDGMASYNQQLSLQRAKAVKSYLVSKGIDKHRLKAIGYGETQPIAGNQTAKGKARNRRIEFTIIDRKVTKNQKP